MFADKLLWLLIGALGLGLCAKGLERCSALRVLQGSGQVWIGRILALSAAALPLAVLALGIKFCALEVFSVPSVSMRPFLEPGSALLASKWNYGASALNGSGLMAQWAGPERGDVALFWDALGSGQVLVKRVIGIGGDIVEIAPDGAVSVNGAGLARSVLGPCASAAPGEIDACAGERREGAGGKDWIALAGKNEPSAWLAKNPDAKHCSLNQGALSCKVPEGSWFALGDNRARSRDSRFFGMVPEKNLIGKALWSFSFEGGLRRLEN